MSDIDPQHDPAWPTPRTDGVTADAAFRVPFSIGIGLSLVIWTVVAQLLAASVFASFGVNLVDDVATGRVYVVVAQLLTFLGAWIALRGTGRWSWRVWGPTRPRALDVVVGVGVGVGGYLLVIGWVIIWTLFFGEPEPVEQMLLDDLGSSAFVVVLTYVAVVLMAPVVEELIYRGVLFQAARRRLGLFGGVALSALVFTVVHVELFQPFQPVGLGGLLLLGAWLALMFHRSGSLTVPIVGHAVFNAINLSLAVFVQQG